jgi:hypothetical protein
VNETADLICLESGQMARRRVVQEGGLHRLGKAHRSYASAEAKLRREILLAHEAGSSLRSIASAVEMSPETVRTLIAKTRAERERDLRVIGRMRGSGMSVDAKDRVEGRRRALASKWGLTVQDLDR